jgi:cephalosporin hydroxylase
MTNDKIFDLECYENIRKMSEDPSLKEISKCYHDKLAEHHYVHNFTWMGVPILQEPTDTMMWQELIMRIKPDLIIETGIARGGSVLLSASLLALLDIENNNRREVIGIDVDIRTNTYEELHKHPELYYCYMNLIQSSSVAPETINIVKKSASRHDIIMVALDSNHTHKHVLAELEAYAPLVTPGSYIVVFDTGIEYIGPKQIGNRPWGPGNSPMSAVKEFLKTHPEFEQDFDIDKKLIITSAPGGWLRRKLE